MSLPTRFSRRRLLGLLSPLALLALAAVVLAPARPAMSGAAAGTGGAGQSRFSTSWVIERNTVTVTSVLLTPTEGRYKRTVVVHLSDGKTEVVSDSAYYAQGQPVSAVFELGSDIDYVEQVSFIKETFDP